MVKLIDKAMHVEPKAEDLRTRVQFPPPPPYNLLIYQVKNHHRCCRGTIPAPYRHHTGTKVPKCAPQS
jgi:hypothetical protein